MIEKHYNLFNLTPFKALSLPSHTLLPTALPLLEPCLVPLVILVLSPQLCYIFITCVLGIKKKVSTKQNR